MGINHFQGSLQFLLHKYQFFPFCSPKLIVKGMSNRGIAIVVILFMNYSSRTLIFSVLSALDDYSILRFITDCQDSEKFNF